MLATASCSDVPPVKQSGWTQGGIHPDFDGNTYLAILAAAKAGAPDIHVHAFSPLEVQQGAATLGWPLTRCRSTPSAQSVRQQAPLVVAVSTCTGLTLHKELHDVTRAFNGCTSPTSRFV